MSSFARPTKQEREATIFRAFLRAYPDFAGEPIARWEQPANDPPDVLCSTVSGRTIGVELRAWLDQAGMQHGKLHERYRTAIQEALAPQPDNTSKGIYFVWLSPKEAVLRGIPVSERAQFRTDVLRAIADIDAELAETCDPQGQTVQDFDGNPLLTKYLNNMHCHPRRLWRPNGNHNIRTWPPGMDWIILPELGGAYTHETMRDALLRALDEKREQYAAKPKASEFYLLIHYDEGLYYNPPIETMLFKVDDAFEVARHHVNSDPGPFDRIFVFLAIEPGERIFQIY